MTVARTLPFRGRGLLAGVAFALIASGCNSAGVPGSEATLVGPPVSSTRPAEAGQPSGSESLVDVLGRFAQKPNSGSNDEYPVPSHGAPKVERPLELRNYRLSPCSLLTDEQGRQLVGASGRSKEVPSTFGGANHCGWSNVEANVEGSGASVIFTVVPSDLITGLTQIYHVREYWGKKTPRILTEEFFEPTTIEGYPAVLFGNVKDDREDGSCGIWVGVRDDTVLQLSGHLSTRKWMNNNKPGALRTDPCPAIATAAGMVIRTMRGKS